MNLPRVYCAWPTGLLSVMKWLAQQTSFDKYWYLPWLEPGPCAVPKRPCYHTGEMWTTRWAGKMSRIFGLKVIQHVCVVGYFFFLWWWTVTSIWGSLLGLILFIICPSMTWMVGQRIECTISKPGTEEQQKLGEVVNTLEGRARAAHQRDIRNLERWSNRNLMKFNNS